MLPFAVRSAPLSAKVLIVWGTLGIVLSSDKRWIDIGLTNFLTGEYKDLYSEDLTGDDFYDAMYAEFAYAGFFKPVKT